MFDVLRETEMEWRGVPASGGAGRGLVIGVIVGLVVWVLMIVAYWWFWVPP
jgi:hypothetical protein